MKTCYGYSSKVSQHGSSNEYYNKGFHGEIRKISTYQCFFFIIIIKKVPYLDRSYVIIIARGFQCKPTVNMDQTISKICSETLSGPQAKNDLQLM